MPRVVMAGHTAVYKVYFSCCRAQGARDQAPARVGNPYTLEPCFFYKELFAQVLKAIYYLLKDSQRAEKPENAVSKTVSLKEKQSLRQRSRRCHRRS